MKYIRTKKGSIYDINEIFYYEGFDSYYDKMHFEAFKIEDVKPFLVYSLFSTKDIVKQADTIEELICEGDLVMAKDYWEPESKKSHVTIIDSTLLPIKRRTVDELYIKQENGDWKLTAEKNDQGELELL